MARIGKSLRNRSQQDAADDAGCRTILIRRKSFLDERRAHEESPMVACNLCEAVELIVAAQDAQPREAAMAMRQRLQQGLQQGLQQRLQQRLQQGLQQGQL